MKTQAHQILGKTITGVYLKYAEPDTPSPRSQLMLLFSDNTCYEFYCDSDTIRPTAGIVYNGVQHIHEYMRDGYFFAYKAERDRNSGKVMYEVHDG